MIISKKFRLQPNKEQEQDFIRFSGANRFAWNECKSYCDNIFYKEKRYVSALEMRKHLQDLKYNNSDFSWLQTVPESVTKQSVEELLNAYKIAFKKRKNDKNYNKYLPKFKKKSTEKKSFYQRTDKIYKTDDTHIKLTGIKKPVKCKGLKGIDLPIKIMNPRIKFDGKFWYLFYSFETERKEIKEFYRESLGIDLGVKNFAICSNGNIYRNINRDARLKKLNRRLKHIQRLISKKYRLNIIIENGKKIYKKTNNIRKLEKIKNNILRKIKNIRKNYIFNVVNDVVRTKPQTIVIENLNVKGMMQNPKLARAIQEQNFYFFRQVLEYKCDLYGINLVITDRFFPSSKTCSNCGSIKKDLKLSDRTYKCNYCGFKIDRDFNASLNLERYPKIKYIK